MDSFYFYDTGIDKDFTNNVQMTGKLLYSITI